MKNICEFRSAYDGRSYRAFWDADAPVIRVLPIRADYSESRINCAYLEGLIAHPSQSNPYVKEQEMREAWDEGRADALDERVKWPQ